ncbi:MAG: 4-hydroxy-tetrahydrodipicolinate reductase [Pseudomonadota bacterium]
MTELNLAIMGAAGRMGKTLINAINETQNVIVSAAIEHQSSDCIGKDSGILAGIGENSVPITTDIEAALAVSDCIIDFTVPVATISVAKLMANHNCAHVIGTTGWTPQQDQEIEDAAQSAVIVKSGNMSLGVNLLASLVTQAARALPASDFDIEVLEMHHKHKIDAPSGTALLLGQAAAEGREIELEENAVRSRDGITGARKEGTVGFATLRGGAVVGDHTVILASNGERIELSHKAQDRSLFANGAIHAAQWVRGKPNGLYSMHDVLGL